MDKLKKNKPQTTEFNKNSNKKLNIKKKESLKRLKNELKEAKENNLRYLAEIDNLRKRFDKEREDTFKYAVTEFANEIILVQDNWTDSQGRLLKGNEKGQGAFYRDIADELNTPAGSSSKYRKLNELNELKEKGVITQQEFDIEKRKIL